MTATGRTMAGIAGAVAVLALGTMVAAQRPGPGWGFGGPGGPGGRGGLAPISGEPFSGMEVRTSTEPLANSNMIKHSSCAYVYRDAAGDTREDITPNSTTCASTPQTTVITNLTAGYRYDINVAKGTYFQMKLRTPPAGQTPPTGTPPNHPRGANGDQVVKTPMGTSSASGVSADGTQTTITIPAGKMGNTSAITLTSTKYFASTLHLLVSDVSTDPRGGTENMQITNIVTGQPSVSFDLPSGLTLQTGHFGGHHGPPPPAQ